VSEKDETRGQSRPQSKAKFRRGRPQQAALSRRREPSLGSSGKFGASSLLNPLGIIRPRLATPAASVDLFLQQIELRLALSQKLKRRIHHFALAAVTALSHARAYKPLPSFWK